jgi:hypothetical protein
MSAKKRPEREASASDPKGCDDVSVHNTLSKGKLLLVVFDGYAKLYSDQDLRLAVTHVADCSGRCLETEAIAVELAELNVRKGFEHLWDERLLLDAISTRVPSVEELAYFESMKFGFDCMNKAARQSLANKRRAS